MISPTLPPTTPPASGSSASDSALNVLLVDDEALARSRLRTLLGDCRNPAARVVAEAANAPEALARLAHHPVDVLLLDIHMPGMDGLGLARELRQRPQPPAIIFVTAYAEHAVQAFEVEPLDYLTKPVRLDRLQAALAKVARWQQRPLAEPPPEEVLVLQDRGRTERLPLAEILYFKAELKYVTVRTAQRSWLWEGALTDLETRFGERFLRIHRNALVARHAIRALEKHHDPQDGEGWAVRLNGVGELLAVSRRQLSAVREAILQS